MPLYYKSLNAHMNKFRKELNLQGLNDELHNLNLKQQLNNDLNKENALLGTVATDIKKEELKKKYEHHLHAHNEKKAKQKAEQAVKHDILVREEKHKIHKAQEANLINAENALMHTAKHLSTYNEPMVSKSKLIKQLTRGAKHGFTSKMIPREKAGAKPGQRKTKRVILNPSGKPKKNILI